ncbi:hypothetical protein GBAR_LOCUS3952 [Geodia barretti]|nr:hypothetical protein GBAR_LOCUS3952 [Geodia barretti]
MTLYDGPLRPGYEQFFNREKLYLVTVTQVGGDTRSFLGEMHHTTWDRRSGPCYYAGDSQGGRTAEREENESLIEGHYTDYQVEGLFGDEFVYSRFERDGCSQTV